MVAESRRNYIKSKHCAMCFEYKHTKHDVQWFKRQQLEHSIQISQGTCASMPFDETHPYGSNMKQSRGTCPLGNDSVGTSALVRLLQALPRDRPGAEWQGEVLQKSSLGGRMQVIALNQWQKKGSNIFCWDWFGIILFSFFHCAVFPMLPSF